MSETDDQEPARSELVGGVIQREYWGWDHRKCVIHCRDPWPGNAAFKCPSCHGKVVIEAKEAPEPSRFGVWIGGWLRAWRDALDVLRVRDPGPQVELPCPVCEAAEWREMAQALISECGEHEQTAPGETVSEAKECQECDP